MAAEVLDELDMDTSEQDAQVDKGPLTDPPAVGDVGESAAVPDDGGEDRGSEEPIQLTD